MAKERKTWREKLHSGQESKLVDDPRGRGKLLIPTPLDVDAQMRRVERGRLITDKQIRNKLADSFHADLTCPLVTGIFIRIAAEAAEEDRRNGREEITPYWRTIKADGSLNAKLPGGEVMQATRLQEEGHTIEASRGKNPPKVKNFEGALQL
jgi:hypothetical protein